jgi:hypothetical protein
MCLVSLVESELLVYSVCNWNACASSSVSDVDPYAIKELIDIAMCMYDYRREL